MQTMTIGQFMSGSYKNVVDEDKLINKVIAHLKRHKVAYRVVGTSMLIIFVSVGTVSAMGSDTVTTGIDAGGKRIYGKLMELAKWVIIIKGGFDTMNNMVKGDTDSAKKAFLGYLLVYVIMLALPWSLDEVDAIFKGMKKA